jgi:DNA-directed RNA polymerase subunit M/transcription elongation factor TFIIS
MKKKEEKLVYDIRLLCRNCEKDWIEKIDKGIYIRSEKDNNYMIKRGDTYKKRKLFTCPKCGAHNKIARRPLIQKR